MLWWDVEKVADYGFAWRAAWELRTCWNILVKGNEEIVATDGECTGCKEKSS